MKKNIIESANAIIKAIEINKNASICEAVSVTLDLDITIADVMSCINEEFITWLDMDGVEIDSNWSASIYDRGYQPHSKIRMIEEYNDGLYNIYLNSRDEISDDDVDKFIKQLERIKQYADKEIRGLCYCDLPTSHDFIMMVAEATKLALEISNKIESLD